MSGLDNPNLGCPLCISYLQHAITTTCGHSFCGKCWIDYWESKGEYNRVTCPVDRKNVNLVIPNYALRDEISRLLRENNRQEEPLDKEYINRRIAIYNQRFSSDVSPSERVRDDFRLFSYISSRLSISSLIFYIIFASGFFYIFVEEDLISDRYGILGYIDDILVFLTVVFTVFKVLNSFRESLTQA